MLSLSSKRHIACAIGGMLGATIVVVAPRLFMFATNSIAELALVALAAVPFGIYYGLIIGYPITLAIYFLSRTIVRRLFGRRIGFTLVFALVVAVLVGVALSLAFSDSRLDFIYLYVVASVFAMVPTMYFYVTFESEKPAQPA
jgi:hypothetical protein